MVFANIEVAAENIKLSSPDGCIEVAVSDDNGQLRYSITTEGKELVAPSRLGMLSKGEKENTKLTINKQATRSVKESWTPICGKRSHMHNIFNELELTVACESNPGRTMNVLFRAYNEGVAFRYVLGPKDKTSQQLTIIKDLSAISFSDTNAQIWSYMVERRPKGPEQIYKTQGFRNYPLVVKNSNNFWLAITEAALHDFDNFDLNFTKGSTTSQFHIDHCKVKTPFTTPWRVIMISETPATFVDSDLLVNLSPPPEGDFSWVKPGISLWDWRAWGHQTKDGFTYGLEINSWKRFIDFAAEQDIPYLLIDANWYGPEHSTLSDPFKGGKALQVKQALDYSKEKGIGLILYLNDKASVNFSIEEIAKAYSEWGAVGIKYGFMGGHNQSKVRKTERVVRACAENKLLVNFHDGPIPPTGHERTWPNWNTREYVHAQSDAKRTHLPSDFVHMAYLNTIAGPIDGNHGMFDHANSVAQRPKMFDELYSTIVAEAARTLILYSGLTVIPDSPDSYKEHPELFRFIAAQKQPWKQSRTLAGEFGKWITTMRQAQDGTYLIATATDESNRTIKISLEFLEPDKRYTATIFQDAKDAHYKTNRSAYSSEHREVTSKDSIEAHLAPGGGHCVIIKKEQRGTQQKNAPGKK
jgi:alpha-glucosidase